MSKTNIGLIGLAVMGANLARNIANHDTQVIVYNRSENRTQEFEKKYGSENLKAVYSLEDLVNSLEKPRKIIVMVQAGDPVDQVIGQLVPLLDKEDIIIDCGNSFFRDTQRRFDGLTKQDIHFVGCGVSGGEEGALNGPSMMPGGEKEIYDNHLKEIFEPIAAEDFSGGKCISFIGQDGAGHYVKMVHNGIEYGVMQIMAEAYSILSNSYNLAPDKISEIFAKLGEGKLKSYLFEIAVEVLAKEDDVEGGFLIDKILDKAGSKGTGMWTSVDAMERGLPLQTITSAVFARYISAQKAKRLELFKKYAQEVKVEMPELDKFAADLENALYVAILSSYAQGFELISIASQEEAWDINFSEVARIWQGGCIIRAELLKFIQNAFAKENEYKHLFEIEDIQKEMSDNIAELRKVSSLAIQAGIPIPAIYSSLEYFESIKTKRLSANFIQGLRDYFGAHTYERIDKDGVFHTEWNLEE